MAGKDLKFSVFQHEDVHVLRIAETRLDTTNAPALKTEILRLVGAGAKKILVNLEDVVTIDSSGLGALTFGRRQLDDVEGTIVFCCLQEKVLSLFKIAKFDRVFSVFETENEGLKSI